LLSIEVLTGLISFEALSSRRAVEKLEKCIGGNHNVIRALAERNERGGANSEWHNS
jgi:hypothetical protein